jgi:hypothetical protein
MSTEINEICSDRKETAVTATIQQADAEQFARQRREWRAQLEARG